MKRAMTTFALYFVVTMAAQIASLHVLLGLPLAYVWLIGAVLGVFQAQLCIILIAWRHPGALGAIGDWIDTLIHGEAA